MGATEALAIYEQRMWEHAVRAMPRNYYKRRVWKWMWRHRLSPPYTATTPERVLLFMRIIELRNERAREQK